VWAKEYSACGPAAEKPKQRLSHPQHTIPISRWGHRTPKKEKKKSRCPKASAVPTLMPPTPPPPPTPPVPKGHHTHHPPLGQVARGTTRAELTCALDPAAPTSPDAAANTCHHAFTAGAACAAAWARSSHASLDPEEKAPPPPSQQPRGRLTVCFGGGEVRELEGCEGWGD